MPHSATFIYFQGLLRQIFEFVKSRYRASCAILKHYLVLLAARFGAKFQKASLKSALSAARDGMGGAETSNLIRRTRVLKNATKFIAKCLNFASEFHPPRLCMPLCAEY